MLGGTLIRSCDVYQRLGIRLPEWVAKTRAFTEAVEAYERVRDHAYEAMARLLEEALVTGASLVIVDAVHGELPKRQAVYGICLTHGATPVIVLCECDDWRETERRFAARRGREGEPEHEASDLAVYRDIKRRWQSPLTDELLDGTRPTIFTHDTVHGRVAAINVTLPAAGERIRAALVTSLPEATRALPLRCRVKLDNLQDIIEAPMAAYEKGARHASSCTRCEARNDRQGDREAPVDQC